MNGRIAATTYATGRFAGLDMALYQTRYVGIGCGARMIYAHLMHLLPLSIANHWQDENGDCFVAISQSELAWVLDRRDRNGNAKPADTDTVRRCLDTLEDAGLIDVVSVGARKVGGGYKGRASHIYPKYPIIDAQPAHWTISEVREASSHTVTAGPEQRAKARRSAERLKQRAHVEAMIAVLQRRLERMDTEEQSATQATSDWYDTLKHDPQYCEDMETIKKLRDYGGWLFDSEAADARIAESLRQREAEEMRTAEQEMARQAEAAEIWRAAGYYTTETEAEEEEEEKEEEEKKEEKKEDRIVKSWRQATQDMIDQIDELFGDNT